MQRDLISLDNPVYLDMRLKVDVDEAGAYLDPFPLEALSCTTGSPGRFFRSIRSTADFVPSGVP